MVIYFFKYSYGGSCACVFHFYHVHGGLFLFCETANITICMVIHIFSMFMVVHDFTIFMVVYIFTMFILIHNYIINHVHVLFLMLSWRSILFVVMVFHAVHRHGISCCS